MRQRVVALSISMLVALGACGGEGEDVATSPTSVGGGGRPDCAQGKPCDVRREQFGEDWPFTVDGGVLRCQIVAKSDNSIMDSRSGVTLEVGGTTYAVNLPALRVAEASGWVTAEQIYANPTSSEFGARIVRFTLFGAKLCPRVP